MIYRFIIIVNFRNHFDKALTEIFQFRRALILGSKIFKKIDQYFQILNSTDGWDVGKVAKSVTYFLNGTLKVNTDTLLLITK